MVALTSITLNLHSFLLFGHFLSAFTDSVNTIECVSIDTIFPLVSTCKANFYHMQACLKGTTGTERKMTPTSVVVDRIVYFHPVANVC